MTLDIGTLLGGGTPENEPTADRIHDMTLKARAASMEIRSDFSLDLTFHVAGPIWKPEAYGVRPGRLTANRKSFKVKIGVPEHFPSAEDRDLFLCRALRQSVEAAESAVRRRGLDWSPSAIHQIVERTIAGSLCSCTDDITVGRTTG